MKGLLTRMCLIGRGRKEAAEKEKCKDIAQNDGPR